MIIIENSDSLWVARHFYHNIAWKLFKHASSISLQKQKHTYVIFSENVEKIEKNRKNSINLSYKKIV